MFHIFGGMNDRGVTGFFWHHPTGAFTIMSKGRAWVTGDLTSTKQAVERTGWGDDNDIAPSAMIQGF